MGIYIAQRFLSRFLRLYALAFGVILKAMSISLNKKERVVAKALSEIKKKSGSHSPSPSMLAGVEEAKVRHDFCYLSNPHATELFLKYFSKDVLKSNKLRNLVEHYPSQNRALAEKLQLLTKAPAKNIFVGNGATEIIQAVLQNFVRKKILVPVPTFSPYLEFVPAGVGVLRHQLLKEKNFVLDPREVLSQVRKEKPDAVVLISPNNPDGGFLSFSKLKRLVGALKRVKTVVVDESFIHFAGQRIDSAERLVKQHPNLIVIKSLSKDFGVAGLRLGYAVMSAPRVSALLKRGYLWNVSGFGEYFLELLNRKDFLREYERARLLGIKERDVFFAALSKIPQLKVYPSRANSFLIELLDGSEAEDLTVRLLVKYGIYVRLCKDKVGLRGDFVRVASRRERENSYLIKALVSIFRGV